VKKSIILSLVLMCISIVLGKLFSNWLLTIKICGSISLVYFGLVGVLRGAFINGDRLKSDNSIDKKEDKIVRGKIINFGMVVGSTNTILAGIIFFITNKS
jgi:hypothetical protein